MKKLNYILFILVAIIILFWILNNYKKIFSLKEGFGPDRYPPDFVFFGLPSLAKIQNNQTINQAIIEKDMQGISVCPINGMITGECFDALLNKYNIIPDKLLPANSTANIDTRELENIILPMIMFNKGTLDMTSNMQDFEKNVQDFILKNPVMCPTTGEYSMGRNTQAIKGPCYNALLKKFVLDAKAAAPATAPVPVTAVANTTIAAPVPTTKPVAPTVSPAAKAVTKAVTKAEPTSLQNDPAVIAMTVTYPITGIPISKITTAAAPVPIVAAPVVAAPVVAAPIPTVAAPVATVAAPVATVAAATTATTAATTAAPAKKPPAPAPAPLKMRRPEPASCRPNFPKVNKIKIGSEPVCWQSPSKSLYF